MDAFVLSVSLEVAIWLGYSSLVGCLTICFLRRKRLNVRRYDVVSTSTSSGETGEVEMEDREGGHVTLVCVDSGKEGMEEGEGSSKEEKPGRWWRKKERKGSKRFLVSSRRSAEIEEEHGGISSQVEEQSPVILTKQTSPNTSVQQQSNDIPTISIPYDNLDEDIPYVDEDDDDESNHVDNAENDVFTSSSSTHSSSTATSNNPPICEPIKITAPPSPSLMSDAKVPILSMPPVKRRLDQLSRRHPRVKKNSTKLVSILLFLLAGYVLTVITAIIVYRSSEFFILYSDAIQCRNISYDAPLSIATSSDQSDESITEDELENCLYFFNQSSAVAFEDVFLRVPMKRDPFNRDPITIHGWWIPAVSTGNVSSSNLTVIYTHGNADNISFFKKLYEFLAADLGVNVFAWDFPGFGKSGGLASEKSIRAAAEQVIEYLFHQRGISEKNIVLWGYSLGGSVAANLATKHKDVRGVIMQAPIDSAADVVSSFLPLTGWSLARILTQKFETKATISSVKSCLLQFVGDEDEMFPISRERALFSRATHVKAKCKKFFTIGGLGHLEDPTENLVFRAQLFDYFNTIV